jgi:hypothetical protein
VPRAPATEVARALDSGHRGGDLLRWCSFGAVLLAACLSRDDYRRNFDIEVAVRWCAISLSMSRTSIEMFPCCVSREP